VEAKKQRTKKSFFLAIMPKSLRVLNGKNPSFSYLLPIGDFPGNGGGEKVGEGVERVRGGEGNLNT